MRRAAKIQGTINVEEFYDYVLAHAPEFARGRQEADEATARGELGKPLTEVAADLEAEEHGEPTECLKYPVRLQPILPAVVPYLP